MNGRLGVGSPPTQFTLRALVFNPGRASRPQSRLAFASIIFATAVDSISAPDSGCVLISQFWQYTHSSVHPEKKMVYEGIRSGSSPMCKKSLFILGVRTLQWPSSPFALSTRQPRSHKSQWLSIRLANSILISSKDTADPDF